MAAYIVMGHLIRPFLVMGGGLAFCFAIDHTRTLSQFMHALQDTTPQYYTIFILTQAL